MIGDASWKNLIVAENKSVWRANPNGIAYESYLCLRVLQLSGYNVKFLHIRINLQQSCLRHHFDNENMCKKLTSVRHPSRFSKVLD